MEKETKSESVYPFGTMNEVTADVALIMAESWK